MNDLVESLRGLGDIRVPDSLYSVAADEIERLEQEVSLYKASDEMLNECCQELAESQAREAKLRGVLAEYHKLTCHDGWYADKVKDVLALPNDDTALKEYRKQVLLEAANWFAERRGYERLFNIDPVDQLRKMAEE